MLTIDRSNNVAPSVHFRTIEDAARFYAAFPMLNLADGAKPG